MQNPEVSKKAKSLFFNQFALKQLAVLLDRSEMTPPSSVEGVELAEQLQLLARKLLGTLCTDYQLGVCYKPKDIPAGLERCVLAHVMSPTNNSMYNLVLPPYHSASLLLATSYCTLS